VVDQTGSVVREGVVDSDPETIAEFVRSSAPSVVWIGLETGPTATWLWTELKQLGLPVICIDARHAKAVLKMQINKSDRNDAAGIARIMQTGWFKEVRVKDLDSHRSGRCWQVGRCWSRSSAISRTSGSNDPTMTAVGGVYTAMRNVYLNDELQFTSTSSFMDLNDQAFLNWNFGHVDPTGAQKGGSDSLCA
jgi:carboxypeptidase C (cathepsin A)